MPYFFAEEVLKELEDYTHYQEIFSQNQTQIGISFRNNQVVFSARVYLLDEEEGAYYRTVKTFPSLKEAVQFCYLHQQV